MGQYVGCTCVNTYQLLFLITAPLVFTEAGPKKTSSEQQQLSCVQDPAASLSVAAEKCPSLYDHRAD